MGPTPSSFPLLSEPFSVILPSICYFPSLLSLRFVFFALTHTVFTASVSSLSPFMPLQFGIHPLGYTEPCIWMAPDRSLVDKAYDAFFAPLIGPSASPLCWDSHNWQADTASHVWRWPVFGVEWIGVTFHGCPEPSVTPEKELYSWA